MLCTILEVRQNPKNEIIRKTDITESVIDNGVTKFVKSFRMVVANNLDTNGVRTIEHTSNRVMESN